MLHGQMLMGQMLPRQLKLIQMALSSLDKIGLVSAEIFHYIETRTNVAWMNVDRTTQDS